jgi:hypothetical protein
VLWSGVDGPLQLAITLTLITLIAIHTQSLALSGDGFGLSVPSTFHPLSQDP